MSEGYAGLPIGYAVQFTQQAKNEKYGMLIASLYAPKVKPAFLLLIG